MGQGQEPMGREPRGTLENGRRVFPKEHMADGCVRLISAMWDLHQLASLSIYILYDLLLVACFWSAQWSYVFYITYINIVTSFLCPLVPCWKKGRNRAAEVGVGIQRGTLGLELSFTKVPQKFHTKVPQKMARHEVMLQNIHLMPAWCVNTSETPVGKVTIGQRHDWRLETFTTFRQSSRRDWMPTLWSPELRQAFLKNDQENVL